jgi:hypothetical protein
MNWGQDTESKSLDALQNAQYSPGRCPHQSKWIMAPACILQCRRTGDVAEKRSSMRVRWFACNNLLALRSGKWFCIRADHPGYPSTVPHTIPCQAYFSSPLGFNNIYNTTKHICISDYLYQGGHSSHKNNYTYSLRWSPLRALWQPLRWYQPSSTILFARQKCSCWRYSPFLQLREHIRFAIPFYPEPLYSHNPKMTPPTYLW